MTSKGAILFAAVASAVVLVSTAGAAAQTPEPTPAPVAPAIAPAPRLCPAGSADSRVFAVLLRGNRAGYETSCLAKDGGVETFYAFNDRGRGPDLHTRVRFETNGTPGSVETEGTDYLKSAIRERFSRSGKAAAWKNKVEEEKRDVEGAAFYVSFSGPLEEVGWLAAAAARAPGRRIALLPAGEASVAVLPVRRFASHGQVRSLRLHAVSGLDFTPSYVWLDESGRFFAFLSEWLTVIPEGWEGAAP